MDGMPFASPWHPGRTCLHYPLSQWRIVGLARRRSHAGGANRPRARRLLVCSSRGSAVSVQTTEATTSMRPNPSSHVPCRFASSRASLSSRPRPIRGMIHDDPTLFLQFTTKHIELWNGVKGTPESYILQKGTGVLET